MNAALLCALLAASEAAIMPKPIRKPKLELVPPAAEAHEVLAALAPGQVACAVGLPSSGKTTVVEKAARSWSRVFVFDAFAQRDRDNWKRGYHARKPWFYPGAPVVTVDQLLRAAASGQLSLLLSPRARVVVCGTRGTFDKLQLAADFSTLVRLLEKSHEKTGRPSVLIAEEVAQYGRNAVDAMNLVANGGAHLGLSLVAVTQRWGRLQKDARENVSLIVAGAIASEEDRDALAARAGQHFADRVFALSPPVNGKATSNPIAWRLGDRAPTKEI